MAPSQTQTGNGFLDGLTPADAALVLPVLRRVDLARGAILIEQGAEIDSVYLPAGAEHDNILRLEDGFGVLTAAVGQSTGHALGIGTATGWLSVLGEIAQNAISDRSSRSRPRRGRSPPASRPP